MIYVASITEFVYMTKLWVEFNIQFNVIKKLAIGHVISQVHEYIN